MPDTEPDTVPPYRAPLYRTEEAGRDDAYAALIALAETETPLTPTQGMTALADLLLTKARICSPCYLYAMASVFATHAREYGWLR